MRKIIFMILLATLALSLAAPVLAQEETPPEVSTEWIYAVWAIAKATPIALLIAFATVLVGYLSKTPPEKFKLDHFIFTLLISLTIGILTIWAGWSYTLIQQWLANGFLTWYIWKVAKILAGIITKKGIFTTATGPPTA